MPPSQTIWTGLVVAIIGFFSSFPIVLAGLDAMGATTVEAGSGLMFAALSMGLSGILLSLITRQPASVAWSTPGVALLAVSPAVEGGFAGAVAGFLIAGLLTLIAGLWRPLGRLATSIPPAVAQAMLAGVLLSLCVQPFLALSEAPQIAVPIIATWFIVGRFSRLFAVPAAVLMAAILIAVLGDRSGLEDLRLVSAPVVTLPIFSVEALLGVGLPLFIVTMATQNIPGLAVMRSYGYTPPPRTLLSGVGAASILTATLGAPATCLAAITAAMCSDEDSHPDPSKRYWSAVCAGAFYCLFGLFAALLTSLAALAPDMLLATVAGVALLGTFANSASAALSDAGMRDAAAITFLATASGVTLFGLSAAVIGLLLGVGVTLAKR
ncbi:benzoate/H(+) symporter BenE family transporter [Pontivivens insulae]|uniref:Inner membrane protein YdcO n=1 Tax=Pontivivens insulae TaxID=1639689 RepID=A0A2R8A6Z1_9RHOB|nr:benzoate/H(+) symporter BenE family transporter [Pontivivens insulae]RED18114.1 benzoate membrane transport protein [Pontivivens insulae]SPF28011.1 Inner membrane protein YdcO [Pontivivens insulae]